VSDLEFQNEFNFYSDNNKKDVDKNKKDIERGL
jgi:hypothetical protein